MNRLCTCLLFVLLLANAACEPEPTATPAPSATLTPSVTPSATASHTPTPTATSTPSVTPSITPSPTITLTPSVTPLPTVAALFDNWESVDLPDELTDGIATPLVAFINQNDALTIRNLSTAAAPTNQQTLYYASPVNPDVRYPILQMTAATDTQVWLSADGSSVAYFRVEPGGISSGLYIIDLRLGLSGRILALPSMVQRGMFTGPHWSPDGALLAIALETGYDLDIYTVRRDGAGWSNLTNNPAYDFYPRWSPDGRYLAFLSDRQRCPQRTPSGDCDAALPPVGGNVFVLDTASGTLEQLSDEWVTEPPRWLNPTLLTFASGDPLFGTPPERRLWLADVLTGRAREVRLADGSDSPLRLNDEWSADGTRVVYQSAGTSVEIIAVNTITGALIGRTGDFAFTRYGMSAAWSPDGTRLALGGTGGQCPYGALVLTGEFQIVAQGSPSPTMCDPLYSPDGQYLAYTGITTRVDGRVDVYVGNFNGFGVVNLTADLRGQTDLLGWVGGR